MNELTINEDTQCSQQQSPDSMQTETNKQTTTNKQQPTTSEDLRVIWPVFDPVAMQCWVGWMATHVVSLLLV